MDTSNASFRNVWFGNLGYDAQGRISDWGSHTARVVVELPGWELVTDTDGDPFLVELPCWELLHVSVKVWRLRPESRYDGFGWENLVDFWVDDWCNILPVFQYFFARPRFQRIAFHVEQCAWTQGHGWETR